MQGTATAIAAREAREREMAALGIAPRIEPGRERHEGDAKAGFRHVGEFFRAVAVATRSDGRRAVDERLQINAATPGVVGSESPGVDGGFAVPVDFAREVMIL